MGVLGLFSYLLRNHKGAFNTSITPTIEAIYLDGNALLYPIAETTKDPISIGQQLLQAASSYADRYRCRCHIYMDGAAHMGKIRQQRMRRFLYDPVSISTPHTDVGTREGIVHVQDIPRWSPAMFSPGTDTMYKIHSYIQDHLYQYPSISIYSSYMEYGEGEHKIIKHIRETCNSRTSSNPYRVAIVGKDADLLLMAMSICQKEGYNGHVYVIRHNDRYDGDPDGYRATDPIYTIDTPMLRDMIISSYRSKAITSIWNFIIASFLIGNDFLPPVPEMIDIYNSIPIILSSPHILYKDSSINWKGLFSLINHIPTRGNRDVYNRWIQGDTSNIDIDTFSTMYYFHMNRFPTDVNRIVLAWITTIQWIFIYYHDGMDSASIAWQYPLSYSPSLYTLRTIDISAINIDNVYTYATEKVAPLTPVQALCAVLPVWLHDLLPIDNRKKVSLYKEYYPLSFNIIDATGDPIIPSIPYDIVSSL